jgi:hypothetical protein
MASPAKFRIDVAMHDLLMHTSKAPVPPMSKGLALPEPPFPQYPERLKDPGPERAPEKRQWSGGGIYRKMRGWLFPYLSNTNATWIAGIAGRSTTG